MVEILLLLNFLINNMASTMSNSNEGDFRESSFSDKVQMTIDKLNGFSEEMCIVSETCNRGLFNFKKYCCHSTCCHLVAYIKRDRYIMLLYYFKILFKIPICLLY